MQEEFEVCHLIPAFLEHAWSEGSATEILYFRSCPILWYSKSCRLTLWLWLMSLKLIQHYTGGVQCSFCPTCRSASNRFIASTSCLLWCCFKCLKQSGDYQLFSNEGPDLTSAFTVEGHCCIKFLCKPHFVCVYYFPTNSE